MTQASLFVALVYAIQWNQAMFPSHAPYNELLFMRQLYRGIPCLRVAQVALIVFMRHLWYVSEDLVPLSLFDERVTKEKKAAMVHDMKKSKGQKCLDANAFNLNMPLSDFFISQSRKALDILLSGQTEEVARILAKSPTRWENKPLFCSINIVFDRVKVVNHVAERAVALITSFNEAIIREEAQKQLFFKVVAKDRRKCPTTLKAILLDAE